MSKHVLLRRVCCVTFLAVLFLLAPVKVHADIAPGRLTAPVTIGTILIIAGAVALTIVLIRLLFNKK